MIAKIKYIFVFILLLSFNYSFGQATNKKVTPKKAVLVPLAKERAYTKWSAKAGANLSVIFLARNTKDNNNSPGYFGGLTYEVNNFIRISSLYTKKKTLLYPFAGFSYNTFSGFFTGELDYLNLKEFYKANTTIQNNWLGLNLGTGIEHNFGILGIFIDYRMRVGKQDGSINIMDVCYTGGLKVRFPYGKLAKSLDHINDRFYWF